MKTFAFLPLLLALTLCSSQAQEYSLQESMHPKLEAFDRKMAKHEAQYRNAETDEARSKLWDSRPNPDFLADQVITKVELFPASDGAPEALIWVMKNSRTESEAASRLMLKNYPDSDAMTTALPSLSRGTKGEDRLRTVIATTKNERVKNYGSFTLAELLAKKSEYGRFAPHEKEAFTDEAKQRLKALSAFDDAKLAEAAKKKLYSLEHLSIGCEAPEIVGVDETGTSFKLSEYRGKVVLLDFWGHW